MSHQATAWAIEQRTGGPSPKATLWSIANYANENWCSWPSQRTLGEESEQSPDTVQRRIRDLEDQGLVRRIPLHYAGRRSVDFFILKPSPYFSAELGQIEPLFPRGYSAAPSHSAAADCGNGNGPKTPIPSDVPRSDAAANAAANAAALVRQPMNLRTKEGGLGGVARASGGLPPECIEIAREVGAVCGYPAPIDWPAKWQQAPYRVLTWISAGWSRENIVAACTEAMAGKRDGPPLSINYFDKPIAKWIARRDQPLPQVKVQERETIHVVRKTDNPARDEFRSALDELKDHNRSARARSGGSGAPLQLLPPDRDR